MPRYLIFLKYIFSLYMLIYANMLTSLDIYRYIQIIHIYIYKHILYTTCINSHTLLYIDINGDYFEKTLTR